MQAQDVPLRKRLHCALHRSRNVPDASIREYRSLFADLFVNRLVHFLALGGAFPEFICKTMADRSQEYARYNEWVSDDINKMAGTLMWNAAKRIALPVGCDSDFFFITYFSLHFLERFKTSLIPELLSGHPPTNSED